MKKDMTVPRVFLGILFILTLILSPAAPAQTSANKSDTAPASPAVNDTQRQNLKAYVDLLRKNVRQQKAEIMGSMLVLSAQDAAKFWPIYSDYDTQLTKLNDQRLQTIKEYAASYNDMTDAKADELIQQAMTYHKERNELLAQTYDKVKQALGGITAARFVMIENQLLLVIDLQILSSLPVVGQGS
jgi:hypothetical protein